MFKYKIGETVKVKCSTDFPITITSRKMKDYGSFSVISYEGKHYNDPKVGIRTVEVREEELE